MEKRSWIEDLIKIEKGSEIPLDKPKLQKLESKSSRAWESDTFGDVVIKIGEKKLSCRHEWLNFHSDFFKVNTSKEWAKTEDGKTLINLNETNVNFSDFSDLIGFLLDFQKYPINQDNVIEIHRLSNCYLFPNVENWCEKFLLQSEPHKDLCLYFLKSNSKPLIEKGIEFFVSNSSYFQKYDLHGLDSAILLDLIVALNNDKISKNLLIKTEVEKLEECLKEDVVKNHNIASALKKILKEKMPTIHDRIKSFLS